VAREFEMARWRPERDRVTGASNWWLSPWRGHWRSPDVCNTSYCNVVRHQGMWRTIVVRLMPVRMILTSRGSSGYDEHSCERAWANPSAKILTPLCYPLALGTNHNGWHESRRMAQVNSTCDISRALYHRVAHWVSLTDHFVEPRSQIFMWILTNMS
jgi:hypothetical protein